MVQIQIYLEIPQLGAGRDTHFHSISSICNNKARERNALSSTLKTGRAFPGVLPKTMWFETQCQILPRFHLPRSSEQNRSIENVVANRKCPLVVVIWQRYSISEFLRCIQFSNLNIFNDRVGRASTSLTHLLQKNYWDIATGFRLAMLILTASACSSRIGQKCLHSKIVCQQNKSKMCWSTLCRSRPMPKPESKPIFI